MTRRFAPILILLVALASISSADETAEKQQPSPDEGYRLLTQKAYVPHHFDQAIFDALWEVWPETLRETARDASPEARRAMAYARYGLTPRPDAPDMPLQYVVDDEGRWTISCLACHGGALEDTVIAGLPNNRFALQSLSDDVFAYKFRHKLKMSGFDMASRIVPMGTTVGTTNAVVFSVTLLQYRDEQLNLVPLSGPVKLNHHDLDAPPWWHYKKRTHIYIDGLAPKGHRSLMQFMLVPQNGRDVVLAAEPDFEHIAAFIESVEAPTFDGPVDGPMVAKGEAVFTKHCAGCHGTYGGRPTYPNKMVPIEKLGTDRLRLDALTPRQRERFSDSWFTHNDPSSARPEVIGYIAPPLDGIWATAPYFHNGSVPTLWHVLHPDERPSVWRRTSETLDRDRMGLTIEVLDSMPEVKVRAERSRYFDTSKRGKSAAGHLYPARLDEAQKRAVLEYLKTL